jgi:hypothetical protein
MEKIGEGLERWNDECAICMVTDSSMILTLFLSRAIEKNGIQKGKNHFRVLGRKIFEMTDNLPQN